MQGFLVMVMVVMVTGAAVQGPKCGFPCPNNYDPVCGSDGETYGNACALESARNCTDSDLTVAHQGECEGTTPECPYSCTYEYVPVCGSDGKTYPNMCVLNMTQACYDSDLTLAHEGECVTTVPDCPVICSTNYDPVCGTDGNTYGNVCALEGENKCYNSDLSFAHKGECDTECAYACPDNYDPVCGSDSVTYPNMCMLSVTQTCYDSELTLAHEGECVTTGECPYGCSGQWDPMCGSDGQTYGNLCELNVTKTCYKPDLTLAHEGECVTTDTECPYACPDNYDPVCGSDGMTYPNLCYLNMINACYDSELTLDHEGECHRPTEPDCPRGCSYNWDPVCGGDGNTYGNLCQLGAERDCNSQSDLTVDYEGECKTRKH